MANKKISNQKSVKTYIDLLYMTPIDVTAKDIAQLLQDNKDLTIQLWEEMNVLELELPNENPIDFEPLEVNFKDPSDIAFVRNRNIKTIFTISLCEDDLKSMLVYFEQLTQKLSGFVCADSVDFTPVYAGSSKKD